VKQRIYLGDERFFEKMQARLDYSKPLDESPATERRPAKPLEHSRARNAIAMRRS
jgi:hypothetical protein